MSIYSTPLTYLNGHTATFADFQDKIVLVVNVASKCGLTPQYEALEAVYQKYGPKGLVILGQPCNQFAGQEPGGADEIQSFCQMNYGVTFPLLAKADVNGPARTELYKTLIRQQPEATEPAECRVKNILQERGWLPKDPADIMWNFEKFIVDRQGQVVARFAPDMAPDDPQIVSCIESLL